MTALIAYAVNRPPHLGGLLVRDIVLPVGPVLNESAVQGIRDTLKQRETGLGPVAILSITKLED